MGIELKWGAPPPEALAPSSMSTGFYAQVAKALRTQPGMWAEIPREFASEDSAKNTATRIRLGRMAAMPKGEFEAVSYEKGVWVRYVAPEEGGQGGNGDGKVHPIRQPARPAPTAPPAGEAAKIRAWAQAQGMDVPKHGRLPQELIDKYDEAHP